jgi:hypothetical protein
LAFWEAVMKLLGASLVTTAVMCLCCGCCPASRDEVKKKINKADVLWDGGKKGDAVAEYLKAQEKLEAAKADLRAAEAKAHKPSPEPPVLSEIEELKDVRFVVTGQDEFVPVYSDEAIGRPYFTLRESASAKVLDVIFADSRCRVEFTSGDHEGDKGWVRRSDLPEKVEKAVAEYLKRVKYATTARDTRSAAIKKADQARRRVKEAERALRYTPATVREAEAAAAALAEKRAKEGRR